MNKNREFKFRIWDIKRMGWVDDYESFAEMNCAIGTSGKIIDLGDSGSEALELDDREQSNYVIQQFTGLKDKSGREIYEGDIVKYFSDEYENDNVTGYIIFDEGSFLNKISNNDIRGISNGDGQIISNIFENPESLSSEQKETVTS